MVVLEGWCPRGHNIRGRDLRGVERGSEQGCPWGTADHQRRVGSYGG
jgi:hypothetical protein